jgi:hypothetical protein
MGMTTPKNFPANVTPLVDHFTMVAPPNVTYQYGDYELNEELSATE